VTGDVVQQAPQDGRRARNMRDKHDRIFRAAAELFAERGFGQVSTQEISDRADVAAGTLFRYATSKAELLLMVFNEELREASRRGEQQAAKEPRTAEAVAQLVMPILERVAQTTENSAAYQRELLFGPAGQQYRVEGLRLIAALERRIAVRLVADAERDGLPADEDQALLAGSTVFAATHLAIARSTTGAHPNRDLFADLRTQIAQVVTGYLTPSNAPDERHP
jgi:AcrR family transcriptional regulator